MSLKKTFQHFKGNISILSVTEKFNKEIEVMKKLEHEFLTEKYIP
jgi:hypothetical protein